MNPQDIVIIAAFALICVITCITVLIRLRQVNKRLDLFGNYIYQMMKANDSSKESQRSISENVNKVNETMSSLTSSIRSLVKQKQDAANEKIYPGPQLLQLIDSCITETILMTATLISRQRVPNDPLLLVSDIVTKTFPHVDTTFLEQRIIYIMEDYNRSNTGQKTQ